MASIYACCLSLWSIIEVIAFPAGGIAAIIIIAIVIIMIIVKIFCVVSGYENRVPVIVLGPEDPKHTLLTADTSSAAGEVGQPGPMAAAAGKWIMINDNLKQLF